MGISGAYVNINKITTQVHALGTSEDPEIRSEGKEEDAAAYSTIVLLE